MEINGSQRNAGTENALDQLNISYWRAVIDMASRSGQDEMEWCRANGAVINSYRKYRELLREEPLAQLKKNAQRKAVIGKDRSRYVEITRAAGIIPQRKPASERMPTVKPHIASQRKKRLKKMQDRGW